jgi:hypothetical protein
MPEPVNNQPLNQALSLCSHKILRRAISLRVGWVVVSFCCDAAFSGLVGSSVVCLCYVAGVAALDYTFDHDGAYTGDDKAFVCGCAYLETYRGCAV